MPDPKSYKTLKETKPNRDYTYKFLIEKGYTPKQSAAIIGNLWQESHGITPNITNRIGAYGIAQWLGKRKEELIKKYPNTHHTLESQLEFLDYELNKTGNSWLSKEAKNKFFDDSISLYDLTYHFRKKFERAGDKEAMDDKRFMYAKKYYTEETPQQKTEIQTQLRQDLTKRRVDNLAYKTQTIKPPEPLTYSDVSFELPVDMSTQLPRFFEIPEQEQKPQQIIEEQPNDYEEIMSKYNTLLTEYAEKDKITQTLNQQNFLKLLSLSKMNFVDPSNFNQ